VFFFVWLGNNSSRSHPFTWCTPLPNAQLCVFNNYGRHAVNTKGRVTAFTHDWMGLCAPVIIAGCITVNGAFLAWTRWTEAGLRDNEDLLVPVLGAPRGQAWQAPV